LIFFITSAGAAEKRPPQRGFADEAAAVLEEVMRHFYRLWLALPLFFCLFAGNGAVLAENVTILPQFYAYGIAQTFPNLEFQDAKGSWRSLSQYRGQWVLVNLWATWCAPCRKEMPQLDRLQEAFKGTPFHILPISLDNPQTAIRIFPFYQEHGLQNLPILSEQEGTIMRTLRPRGLPSSWLIDPQGRAVGEVIGYARWDSEEAGNLIEYYLQRGQR
jgi:thiol-disulfide isomerase/thioredoxin